MPRNAINAANPAAVGPYSHAVEANGLLFLSGQIPLDPATGKLVEGNIAQQTAQCFANALGVLKAAGLTMDDVVTVTVYVADMADFATVNEVYAKQFSKPYPSRTTIGVASLPLNAAIEIGMTAKMRA
jgi:2-iminobutanoate/2-iminopropanoate deaminase